MRVTGTCLLAVSFFVSGCGDDDSGGRSRTTPITTGTGTPPQQVQPICYEFPVAAVCQQLEPLSGNYQDQVAYVQDAAVPLRCSAQGQIVDDFSVLHEAFAEQKVFMMGEVHGSNEIGIMSDKFFRYLVEHEGVNALAIEMPMDLQSLYNAYASGSNVPEIEEWLGALAPNMFGRILPESARELVQEGYPIAVYPVDNPYGTEAPINAITEVAASLSANADLVLNGLPEPRGFQEYLTEQYVADSQDYVARVLNDLEFICTELSDAQCDRLAHMAMALWTAVARWDSGTDWYQWFEVREYVIFHNLRYAFTQNPQTKMFMHMGAFHTNEHDLSAGSGLAREFEPTRDKTLSVAAAYGWQSEIWYSEEIIPVGADPQLVADALDGEQAPHFVYTREPSATCADNPVGVIDTDVSQQPASLGEAYDALLYIDRLTPEHAPHLATLSLTAPSWVVTLRRQQNWIRDLEQVVLGKSNLLGE